MENNDHLFVVFGGISMTGFVARLTLLSFLSSLLLLALPQPASADYAILEFPGVGSWNGFNSHLNVAECTNFSSETVGLHVEVRRSNGSMIGERELIIAAKGTVHTILNEFVDEQGIGIEDSHGTYRLSQSSGPSDSKLSCLTAIYRLGSDSTPEYAFALPVENEKSGILSGMYNSIFAGLGNQPVQNWLTVFNPGSDVFNASVNTFMQDGSVGESFPLELVAGARADIPLGHTIGQVTGIYQIVPEVADQPYGSFLSRYHTENGSNFTFGFSLASLGGSCNERLAASSMGNATNWLEMGNPNSDAKQVTVEVRDRFGEITHIEGLNIPAYGQANLYLNTHIDPAGTGNVGSVEVSCEHPFDKILIQSTYYGRPVAGSEELSWAYATQAKGSPLAEKGDLVVGAANTFFGAANWLKISNSSDLEIGIEPAVFDALGVTVNEDQRAIGALGVLDYGVHESLPSNAIGTISAESGTTNAAFGGELLRVYLDANGAIAEIMPTPLAIISSSSLLGGDDQSEFEAPSATPASIDTFEITETAIVLNGFDQFGRELSFVIVDGPTHGTLSGTAPELIYNAGHFIGEDSFTFRVIAGGQESELATVSISVAKLAEEFSGEMSLQRYRSVLTRAEVDHLLKKVAFGGSEELRIAGLGGGLAGIVEELLKTDSLPGIDEFAHAAATYEKDNTNITIDGEDVTVCTDCEWNTRAAQNYWLAHIRYNRPLEEKMGFILHDWMAVDFGELNFSSNKNKHSGIPQHIDLIRDHGLGNFESLIQNIHYDPAMLVWLDNQYNTKDNNNENYAREHWELFTLGTVGHFNGVVTYLEADMLEATRAMTGLYFLCDELNPDFPVCDSIAGFWDEEERWDNSKKTIFVGQAHEATFPFKHDDLTTYTLFSHPESPRYIAGKICAQLTTPECPAAVVEELAGMLVENGFDLAPIVQALLESSLMFSEENIETGIKSPLEFFAELTRRLDFPVTHDSTFDSLRGFSTSGLSAMGQMPGDPDNIFGFKGRGVNRDQITNYGEIWLSAHSLLERQRHTARWMELIRLYEDYNLDSLLPSLELADATEELMISHFEELFNFKLSNEDKTIVTAFLNDPIPWYDEELCPVAPDNDCGVTGSLRDDKIVGLILIFATHPKFSVL